MLVFNYEINKGYGLRNQNILFQLVCGLYPAVTTQPQVYIN